MKYFDFRKKHRKLKQDISKIRVNFLRLRSSIRKNISKKSDLTGKLQPRVLILRTGDEIGDAIISTGLAKKLHDAGYQVNFLAGKSIVNLFTYSDFINKVFLYDREKSPRQLKREKFDIVIDLNDILTFRRINLIYNINANMTIGFNKSKYPMYSSSIDFMDIDIHITERYKKVLDLLGIDSTGYEYSLGVSDHDEKVISEKMASDSVKYLVALNPLTSSEDKNLSKNQVEKIVSFIKENYHGIGIILMGKYEKISNFQTDGSLIFPESTISFAAAIVKKADLIITPDTSIVHLSRVFNKKMVAIYNNGRVEETGFLAYNMWLPGYENSTVIRVNTPNISEFDTAEIIQKVKEIIPAELLKLKMSA
ncbi:glycosyltransferase family 9 protein [Ewingella sp. S1.OA.A_B6]